ncbi:MAG: hypothetical protein M3Q07_19325 [Pseudobdellovibrionaceae bacterium]|nr:hypothetical protein [Pseudobdellovibrionaceae bacterium]
MKSNKFAVFVLLMSSMPCFGYEQAVDTEISGIRLTYHDFAGGDFEYTQGEVKENAWYFANGIIKTPGCPIQTVAYEAFGNEATENGYIQASLDLKRYSWYGSTFAYDNLPLVSLIISYRDEAGLENREPHLVPIHSIQRFFQFGDELRAINSDWTINLPTVHFKGEIRDLRFQLCSLAGGSIIEMKKLVMRLSDG